MRELKLSVDEHNKVEEFLSLYSLYFNSDYEEPHTLYYKNMEQAEFELEITQRKRWLNELYECTANFDEMVSIFRNESLEVYISALRSMLNIFSSNQLRYMANDHNYDNNYTILHWILDCQNCCNQIVQDIWDLMLADEEGEAFEDKDLILLNILKEKRS